MTTDESPGLTIITELLTNLLDGAVVAAQTWAEATGTKGAWEALRELQCASRDVLSATGWYHYDAERRSP